MEEKIALDIFVYRTREDIVTKTFRPEKYTDPRGVRLYTILPIYSAQMRFIPLNKQALQNILKAINLESLAIEQWKIFAGILLIWKKLALTLLII
jgi:hypothetical protein